MSDKIIYFAYGHNTNVGEMQKRISQAKLLGSGTLYGYKFDLDHFANILPHHDSKVDGVLWAIPAQELSKLDYDEDYAKHYTHKKIHVYYGNKQITALTYVMLNTYRSDKLPTRKYIEYIAQGYRENKISLKQLISALEKRIRNII